MSRRHWQRASAAVLGGGSLAFAAWAIAQPRSFAKTMGVRAEHARWLGVRDLVIGALLLGRSRRAGFILRAVADAADATTIRDARPGVALAAAGFAAWASAAALATGPSQARLSQSPTRRQTPTPPAAPDQRLAGPDATAKIRSLLGHFRSAMMTTWGLDGTELHVRPMGLQGADHFDGALWFFTDERSRKVPEVLNGRRVSLVCQNDDRSAYLHLVGSATIVENRERMRQLYTPLLRTWFPAGLDDPHLVLLRFDAERGEFWESPGGVLQVFAAFAKSVVTGSPGKGGEMGTVSLEGQRSGPSK